MFKILDRIRRAILGTTQEPSTPHPAEAQVIPTEAQVIDTFHPETTYEMEPLSIEVTRIQIPDNLVILETFGKAETEAMAALIIRMCQEVGHWCGYSWSDIQERAQNEHARARNGQPAGMIFTLRPLLVAEVGCVALREQGLIRVVKIVVKGEGDYSVIFPTERLLDPLLYMGYIRA
jgi:hypothetical protein